MVEKEGHMKILGIRSNVRVQFPEFEYPSKMVVLKNKIFELQIK
jgi:hypothetical protein